MVGPNFWFSSVESGWTPDLQLERVDSFDQFVSIFLASYVESDLKFRVNAKTFAKYAVGLSMVAFVWRMSALLGIYSGS